MANDLSSVHGVIEEVGERGPESFTRSGLLRTLIVVGSLSIETRSYRAVADQTS